MKVNQLTWTVITWHVLYTGWNTLPRALITTVDIAGVRTAAENVLVSRMKFIACSLQELLAPLFMSTQRELTL